MGRNKSAIYVLFTLAYVALLGSYYWVVLYFYEQNNPQRDELVTGFMMTAFLSSPIWIGLAAFSFLHRSEMSFGSKLYGFMPATLNMAAFFAIWSLK